MTWQVEQAICPSQAPSSGWPSRWARSSRLVPAGRLDLLVERAVGLQEPHLGSCRKLRLLMRRLVDPAAGRSQLLLAGIAAEAQADRRARLAIAEADRAQHMAWPARTAGAGRPERKGDVAHVGDQPRAIEAVAADVEIAAIAMVSRCR